jgi:hypothetical protein
MQPGKSLHAATIVKCFHKTGVVLEVESGSEPANGSDADMVKKIDICAKKTGNACIT